MKTADELKRLVQDKYASLVTEQQKPCGCRKEPKENEFSVFNEDYSHIGGYNPDADLNLGCGIPAEYARIREGEWVLDLGSGAGNDCFVARSFTGEKGHVTGLDFTPEMISKAEANLKKLGYKNMNFVLGDIEKMPLEDEIYDLVISNCVLNLIPNKIQAFKEIARVLKNKGRFCISDIVLIGELPDDFREAAALYAGCVSGALQEDDYIGQISKAGFTNIRIEKRREVFVPDNWLLPYVSVESLRDFRNSGAGIYSITVTAHL